VSDVSKWSFTTWRPLVADPFGNMDAIWYPRVQVDPLLTSLFQRIEDAEKERDEARAFAKRFVDYLDGKRGEDVSGKRWVNLCAEARRVLARGEEVRGT
jgi:hypothetical protein